jgi:hypothetical protein
MEFIRIGLECTIEKLRSDMLSNPGRYFFILILEGKATLCIRTCNSLGSDLKEHEVQGLQVDPDGTLISVFQDHLDRAMEEKKGCKVGCSDYWDHSITPSIEEAISSLPSFIDYLLIYLTSQGRHIVFYPPLVA